ncbi:YpiF family protein [Halobacillus shinanisalinarum]|uniref:YpiF family protein n=1 Tax=Halobacillus shinanisalinarum TaxID=2932258 RepID=A0ABY4GZV7_9BACI|nr:DUF2487 family protein [Halobacillus shinanisalinarum]UOQ93571.1 YpiF family protein [Halobacillus shinanisalinarum]
MQWTKQDTKQYLPEKEYVDTVLIPIISFDPASDNRMTKEAFQRELNQIFTNLIEKEYKGRMFLAPEYYYLTNYHESEISRMNQWVEHFQQQPFEHVFLFTFDAKWKKYESDLNGHLLWIPGIADGDLQSTETKSFVKEQVKQVNELIQAYW